MRKQLQKLGQALLILSVIAAFGCITALTLIIAQGGKITREGITQTGILRINAEPSDGIKTFIDGEKVTLTDKRIEGLEEGTYTLRIEKEGYLPWEKKVRVDVGIVKEIYASLLKEDLELQQLTNTNIDSVFFSPDGNYAYYVISKAENTDEKGIWRLKLTQNTLESIGLVNTESEKISGISKNIEKVLKNDYLIDIAPNNSKLIIRSKDSSLFYIYYNDNNQLVEIDSPTSLGFIPDEYSWFKDGESMIAKTGSSIYEINLNSNKITLVFNFQDSTPTYAVNGRNVILYTNEKYYGYENETRNLLNPKFELPIPSAMWLSEKSDELLYLISGDDLYFVNLKKDMVKVGEYNVIDVSNDGQNAILTDPAGALYTFRAELIVATDEIQTSLKQIQEKYDSKTQAYMFSPDNNYLLERVLANDLSSFRLIGLYGENNYELLETDRHVGDSNFGLVNGSSEFLILLKDIVPDITIHTDSAETESSDNPTIPDANLYKIELVD